jgi:deoxyribodipyrimidine photo-lyase
MQQTKPAIIWLRQDLRLEDNPALQAAANHPLIAVYIWDEKDPWSPGGASRWWLYKSLHSLRRSFEERGVQLIFRRGSPLQVLNDLVTETKACAIYWNRCYEPYSLSRDQEIKTYLNKAGIPCESFKGSLLIDPWKIESNTKGPYQIFTSFWNVLKNFRFHKPLPVPDLQGWKSPVDSDSIEDWGLHPTLWGQGLEKTWQPGEKGASEKLNHFLNNGIKDYVNKRDYPSEDSTSHLSPYLHWGELSPTQIWYQASLFHGADSLPFLRQLGWREFSYHLLFHFPKLPLNPMRSSFANFPWETNSQALEAWQRGKTGYPLVDAGMRELWHTGGMHNRVRMVVGSFLVKDLLLPWQKGQEWFWDTLVDADLANNAVSWQWVAGCGVDTAPYFRILNPSIQSQKFDPNGTYIKTWVPELQALDSPYIHSPWEAPADILEKAGVQLGGTYPFPIVDHALARKRALEALRTCSVELSI